MTLPTTTRLIATLRALAEECENADEGTPELGRRVEAALGFAEGGRIATDVGTALRYAPPAPWTIEYLTSGPPPWTRSYRYVVRFRNDTIGATGVALPLVICAVILWLRVAYLEQTDS